MPDSSSASLLRLMRRLIVSLRTTSSEKVRRMPLEFFQRDQLPHGLHFLRGVEKDLAPGDFGHRRRRARKPHLLLPFQGGKGGVRIGRKDVLHHLFGREVEQGVLQGQIEKPPLPLLVLGLLAVQAEFFRLRKLFGRSIGGHVLFREDLVPLEVARTHGRGADVRDPAAPDVHVFVVNAPPRSAVAGNAPPK